MPHSIRWFVEPQGLSAHNSSQFLHLLTLTLKTVTEMIIEKEHEYSAEHTVPSTDVLGLYDW